jgi:hypothetical protein
MREMARRACTTHYRDRIQQGILLRSARNEFEKIQIRRMILNARAAWKIYEQHQQRNWGSKVSRRPQRGNHHDSWATREAYVRCHGDYSDYIHYSKKFWVRENLSWKVAA